MPRKSNKTRKPAIKTAVPLGEKFAPKKPPLNPQNIAGTKPGKAPGGRPPRFPGRTGGR